MLLHENKSYLDNQSIQAGLATEKLNHIIVDRYFTEEEKAANLKFHETASQKERTKLDEAFGFHSFGYAVYEYCIYSCLFNPPQLLFSFS